MNNIKIRPVHILFILLILFFYIPSEFFAVLILAIDFWSLIVNHNKIKSFRQTLGLIIPLISYIFIGISIGIIFISNNSAWSFARDLFYHMNPLLFTLFAYTTFVNQVSKEDFIKTIISVGAVLSIITLLSFIVYSLKNGFTDVNIIRKNVSKGESVVYLAFFLGLCFQKQSKLNSFCMIINLMSIIIMFSRTYFIMLALLFLFRIIYFVVYERSLTPRQLHMTLLAISITILVFFAIGKFVPSFYDKLFNSFSEVRTNNDWNDWATITKKWRGYEIYKAMQTYSDYDFVKKLFGSGFGYSMPLGVSINLGGDFLDEIPILHNGYFGAIIKCGLIGFMIYLLYFINCFRYIKLYVLNKKEAYLLYALIIYLMVSSYIIMGLFAKKPDFIVIFFVTYLLNLGCKECNQLKCNNTNMLFANSYTYKEINYENKN